MLAFTDARRGLLAPVPTFEEPARRARQLQRPVYDVPVRADLQVDLDAMARHVPDAGLIFLCNPNNPTSVALPLEQVRAFVTDALKRSPDIVVLLDEAYIEYADGAGVATALPIALRRRASSSAARSRRCTAWRACASGTRWVSRHCSSASPRGACR